MEKNEIGLSVKVFGNYFEARVVDSLHNVKSIAGKLFHNPIVESVCVYDSDGVARLYLKRLPDGSYHREVRPV